jgi:chromosome segregation ATPase
MDETAPNGLPALKELEGKVRRAVEELHRLRTQRDTALAEAEKLRSALRERGESLKRLETQLLELENERAQVRERIEQLVAQIDALTEAES